MRAHWLERFKQWLCESLGHPFAKKGWVYDGYYHRDCRCGRIISELLKEKK